MADDERTIISRTIEEKNQLRRELDAAKQVVEAARGAVLHDYEPVPQEIYEDIDRLYEALRAYDKAVTK